MIILTTLTILATLLSLFAITVAIQTWELTQEIAERIDTLWEELFDDEINHLREQGDL